MNKFMSPPNKLQQSVAVNLCSEFTILVLRELGELVFLGLAAVSCCIVLNVVHRELAACFVLLAGCMRLTQRM